MSGMNDARGWLTPPAGANAQWLIVVERNGRTWAWQRLTKWGAEWKLRREMKKLQG